MNLKDRKIKNSRESSQDLVKTILIGTVPDRGGRVSQTKPKNILVFGHNHSRR